MSNATICYSNTPRQLPGCALKTSQLSFMVLEATESLKNRYHVKCDKMVCQLLLTRDVLYWVQVPRFWQQGSWRAPVGRGRALFQFWLPATKAELSTNSLLSWTAMEPQQLFLSANQGIKLNFVSLALDTKQYLSQLLSQTCTKFCSGDTNIIVIYTKVTLTQTLSIDTDILQYYNNT